METIEILRRAKLILKKRGWCQGEEEDSDGRVCLEGAIQAASFGRAVSGSWTRNDWDATIAPCAAVSAVIPKGHLHGERPPAYCEWPWRRILHLWNDAQGRTSVDVHAVLYLAIEKLKFEETTALVVESAVTNAAEVTSCT